MLFGTPDQVRSEIRARIEEFGMAYFIFAGDRAPVDRLFVFDVAGISFTKNPCHYLK
jgi:alkanesulfonate monooxygenase SsuD/methylene tetrahydromethanopterin reductase-like flavin-dependent oxidoreductase (luciferase family)